MSSNKNFSSVPFMELGFGKTYATAGVIKEPTLSGALVRIKAVGETKIRLENQSGSEILLSDGETEYFFIPQSDNLYLISGKINLMY